MLDVVIENWPRPRVLAELTPLLSPEERERALAAAPDIDDDNRRAHVLAALVPHLPAERRATCLEIITGCLPTLRAHAGSDLGTQLRKSLADVCRWWP